MKQKINWDDFNKIQDNLKNSSMCNGEINTVSEQGIIDFNTAIRQCLMYSNFMKDFAKYARGKFENKS